MSGGSVPGDAFDGYELVDAVVAGRVFLARHLRTAAPVVLKLATHDEARALQRLAGPGVAELLDTGTWRGQPWLATRRVAGATLTQRMRALERQPDGRLTGAAQTWLLDCVAALATTLARIHDAGWAHLDVTPDNVFVDDDGRTTLLDFGLATAVFTAERRATLGSGARFGTPGYAAPEQLQADLVDERADLYALGALLFEGLVGRPAFPGDDSIAVSRRQLTEAPPRLEGLPPPLAALVQQLLARRPRERTRSALDVARSLARLQGHPAAEPPAVPRVFRPALVGRSAARRELDAALARARLQLGSLLLLEGESGVGKTALIDSLCRAAAGDFLVLCCRNERAGEQGSLEELWHSIPARRPGFGTEAQALTWLKEQLGRLASTQPVLLVLGDLQWADRSAFALLESLTPAWWSTRRGGASAARAPAAATSGTPRCPAASKSTGCTSSSASTRTPSASSAPRMKSWASTGRRCSRATKTPSPCSRRRRASRGSSAGPT